MHIPSPDQFACVASRIFIAAACALSLGAAVSRRCQTCKAAAGSAGGLPLAWMGFAYYGICLILAFSPRPLAAPLVAGASGIHCVLMATLQRYRINCPQCRLTACAAFLATALTAVAQPGQVGAMLAILAAAAVSTRLLLPRLQRCAAKRMADQADRVLADIATDAAPVTSGHARLIVLHKPNCPPCESVRSTVLPALTAQFQDRLEIEWRPVPPGMPAPTLLILGKRPMRFVGLPPISFVATAIVAALSL